MTLVTPPDNPGIDAVTVCDVSGCSTAPAHDGIFTYYPVGDPEVSSVTPAHGPAGTTVTIDGANLGFVAGVFFGTVKASTFANVPAILDSGSTSQVIATVPTGKAGTSVRLRVETLESLATGYGKSPVDPAATFTYGK